MSESLSANIFSGRVRDLSAKGLGVVDHPDGLVFFVPGTWPGDAGEFEVESLEKRYGFARVRSLHELSPERVEVPCPHQGFEPGRCGGCPWMIADYAAQMKYKEKILRHLLERSQLVDTETVVHPALPSPQALGYRNRAQLKTDGERIGFVSTQSHVLAEIEDCLVLTDPNRETLRALRARLPNPKWRPTEGFEWSFLDINESIQSDQVVINRRLEFLQGNSAQNRRMKDWLREKIAGVPETSPVLELFCGSGNFTEVLVEKGFERILAVEVSKSAIHSLKNRNWKGVEAIASNIFKPSAWNRIKRQMPDAALMVLDPPRAGFKEIPRMMKELRSVQKIIYISCEPHSFTRDAVQLRKRGFRVAEIQPLDQFPHTPHMELLAVLERQGS